jgi:hypothetical protein
VFFIDHGRLVVTAMTTPAAAHDLRELDHRMSGGLEIRLLWDARENSTIVELRHGVLGDLPLQFEVPPERALDAFRHPFAHLAADPDDVFVE